MTSTPTLPDGTYGIVCRFPNSARTYTYLAHADLGAPQPGDTCIVDTPRGMQPVTVEALANDLAPVTYMKYIVGRVAYTRWRELQSAFNQVSQAAPEAMQ